jgi:ParB family chromosome partitioning protein
MTMAEEAARSSRLGRGLAALIGDMGSETAVLERGRGQRRVPIEFLRPNPNNPRRNFADAELEELASSIRERGIIQPIIVRPVQGANDAYEIIAGERRWRAAQRAGAHDVPVVIVEASDAEVLEIAIIENVQRADLNAIEEATGYQMLSDRFDHSQEDIAKIVGKSRSHVANTMRLLKLSDPVKALVIEGKLSAGHARMLLGQPNALEIAQDIIKRGLNVRQVELMARKSGKQQADEVLGRSRIKDPDTVLLERRVSGVLGLDVSITHRADGGGALHVKYSDLDQLEEVLRKLERK